MFKFNKSLTRIRFSFKSYPALLLLIIFLISGLFLISQLKANNVKAKFQESAFTKSIENLSAEEIAKQGKKIITEIGSKKAYEIFSKQNTKVGISQQHINAHVFGKALYQTLGLNGLSTCDNSFNYGCYHSFLGTAIHEQGFGVVNKLNQVCIDNLKSESISCQHGIGHGILANSGYEYKNLLEALELCKKLPFNDPIGGCFGGVFMEYNFQTMLDVDGTTRSMGNDLNFPCDDLSSEFKTSCFFWQAQWWAVVLNGEINNRYERIGPMCKDIPESKQRERCYLGAGNSAVNFTNYIPQKTVELCKILGKDNIEGEVLCRGGAGNAYFAMPSTRNLSPQLCKGLVKKDAQKCLGLLSILL